ncbi:MAG: hypothetical protein ACLUT3_06815 [Bifidobacterium bifidum]
MHRLDYECPRLLSIRKSLGLYHHEEFFTRLTQLGLFKPSSRVQWYLPDGTTPMDSGLARPVGAQRSRCDCISQDEVDVLIVINGDRRPTAGCTCRRFDVQSAMAVGADHWRTARRHLRRPRSVRTAAVRRGGYGCSVSGENQVAAAAISTTMVPSTRRQGECHPSAD